MPDCTPGGGEKKKNRRVDTIQRQGGKEKKKPPWFRLRGGKGEEQELLGDQVPSLRGIARRTVMSFRGGEGKKERGGGKKLGRPSQLFFERPMFPVRFKGGRGRRKKKGKGPR